MVPSGPNAKYWRKLAWSSASFAIMSDVAMGSLGGSLKMKEKLTGRYADVLSWMYLASATLRRYEAEGFRADHKDVVDWAMRYSFHRIQEAFDGIFANFDVPVIGALFRWVIGSWSRINSLGSGPSDRLGHKLSAAIQVPGAFRDSLSQGIPLSAREGDAGWRIENAFRLNHEAGEILHRISEAVKAKTLPKKRPTALVKEALAAKVITEAEAKVLEAANEAREDVIQVDSYSLDEFEPNLLDVKRAAAQARPEQKSKIG
jgi:acyl-CoA dehydrogenase